MTETSMPATALGYLNEGRGAALATVISTWGSAPRPIGAQLAIAGDGAFEGSVSGGCVEGAVILAAQDAIESGKPEVLEFGVADENAFAVGLACGGEIKIIVEPIGDAGLPSTTLEELAEAEAARRPFGYRVNLSDFSRSVLETPPDRPQLEGEDFLFATTPTRRLLIIGAVHISQHLASFARAADHDVTVLDPRDSFATEARFPNTTLINDWPADVIKAEELDPFTALVALTHDPKIDQPVLETALRSEAYYIGALGSTRTQAKRAKALQEAGFTDAEIARIHGPIGADIAAASPAEIAVSILAEITERYRRPETRR